MPGDSLEILRQLNPFIFVKVKHEEPEKPNFAPDLVDVPDGSLEIGGLKMKVNRKLLMSLAEEMIPHHEEEDLDQHQETILDALAEKRRFYEALKYKSEFPSFELPPEL